MNNALLIASRELRSYFRSPIGYVVAAAVLLTDGILFQAMAMQGARLSAQVLFDLCLVPNASRILCLDDSWF